MHGESINQGLNTNEEVSFWILIQREFVSCWFELATGCGRANYFDRIPFREKFLVHMAENSRTNFTGP